MDDKNTKVGEQEIINAYNNMEMLPVHLHRCAKKYSEAAMAETECHRTVAESAKNVFEDKKASLEKQRKDMYDVADSAKRII